jgi:hypothetical protein
MGGSEGQEFTELLKLGSLERSESFGCYVRRECREVWEVREVEYFFGLDRPESILGLVAKKNFFSGREVCELGRMRRTYGSSQRKKIIISSSCR